MPGLRFTCGSIPARHYQGLEGPSRGNGKVFQGIGGNEGDASRLKRSDRSPALGHYCGAAPTGRSTGSRFGSLRNSTESMKLVEAMRSPDERILPEKEFFGPLILHNLLEQLMLWRKAIVFGGYHRDSLPEQLEIP